MNSSDVSGRGKHSIGFMMSTPEPPQDTSAYLSKKRRQKLGCLNVLTFMVFLFVLILILISLVSPYWLGLREPWIERMLVPKQFQIDPDKHNAWIGLYFSCNTENQCENGTPFDDRGWYRAAQVFYALGFVVLLIAFIIECIYVCCVAYIKIPSYKLVYVVSGITILGSTLCSISLGIYGTSTLNDGILTPMSLNGPGGVLAWAYFLGIVGVALSGLCSFLFLIDGMIKSGRKDAKFMPYYYKSAPPDA